MIVSGIHLPDGSEHFADQLAHNPLYEGKGTYRWSRLHKALMTCGERRGHAVDIGAHVGLWSRVLAHEFRRVTAFEPFGEFAECFERNLDGCDNVVLNRVALGIVTGPAFFAKAEDGEGTASWGDAGADVEAKRLDDCGLAGVDFLKVSCEGMDHFAVVGGEFTIRRDRPVVLVEQKRKRMSRYGLRPQATVDLLISWGARIAWDDQNDFCMVWR